LSQPEPLTADGRPMRVSRVCFGTGSDGRPLRCAPFLIVSLSLRINPSNKFFDVCFDKWCHSLENGKKFGTNLADLANMLSLIHRNLYRGLMFAIWAEVLSWFTNGDLIAAATE
jgi:hypothetical protein